MNVKELIEALGNAPEKAVVFVRNSMGDFADCNQPMFRLDENSVYLDNE